MGTPKEIPLGLRFKASEASGPMVLMGNGTNETDPSPCNYTIMPEYKWVNTVFGECMETDLQVTGFMLGLISNVCWFFAQAPQIWKNYRRGGTGALSRMLIVNWL